MMSSWFGIMDGFLQTMESQLFFASMQSDGFISVGEYGALKLLDEDKTVLDSEFRARVKEIDVGQELEFTGYLATVEELCVEDEIGGSRAEPVSTGNFSQYDKKPLFQSAPQTHKAAPMPVPRRIGISKPLSRSTLGVAPLLKHTLSNSAHLNKPEQSNPSSHWMSKEGRVLQHVDQSSAREDEHEEERKYNKSYFKKMKYNKLFGNEGDDDDTDSSSWQGSPEAGMLSSSAPLLSAPRQETSDMQRHTTLQHRSASHVLALMGIPDEAEPPHEQPHAQQYPVEPANGKSCTDVKRNSSFDSR
jgi:hypothetical protein